MQKYDKHSVTDFLKENGMASGLKARRELFHELIGREKYTGAAEQNMLLLRTLKQRLAIEKKTTEALRTEQAEVGMGILKRTMDIPQIIDASPTQPLALPTKKDSMHESMEASNLLRKIDYVNIASLNTNDIHGTLISLKKLQEEGRVSLDEIQKRLIPPTEYVLGMFYSDRFVEQELPHLESRANVPAGHPYRQSVARIQKAVPHARMVRDRYHALIAEYIRVFGDASHDFTSIASLFPAGVAKMPSYSELSTNHQDAIDIFFQSRRSGMEEIGPEIRAMNGGIVLAAAGDWMGGAGIELYQSEGLRQK